ncbi:hypothetical protein [Rhodoferax sp. BAB1]|jgi:hypothetical protein|uniref:hypothetical protein n=1 Tax=Rhodoferax sp. BAB1 TaxID=2741720 RepID=UPI00157515C9|nr:hypothetical protein [Rhodoferax sp. BAB1]QKO22694.1 hypothetical protein HTY51_12810 [Rhodoferax sp. BAB1]
MADQPSLRFSAGFVLMLAAVLLLPALWSFGSAVASAISTGEVLVISVGLTETARQMVPWKSGWARFAGPLMIAIALSLYVLRAQKHAQSWWIAAALAFSGLCLLLYSAWFVSLGAAAAFVLIWVFIAASFWLDAHFGRWWAFCFMLACALSLAIYAVGT